MTSSIMEIPARMTLISNANHDNIQNEVYMADTEQKCLDEITRLGLTQ